MAVLADGQLSGSKTRKLHFLENGGPSSRLTQGRGCAGWCGWALVYSFGGSCEHHHKYHRHENYPTTIGDQWSPGSALVEKATEKPSTINNNNYPATIRSRLTTVGQVTQANNLITTMRLSGNRNESSIPMLIRRKQQQNHVQRNIIYIND